jgi:hypothetical protein
LETQKTKKGEKHVALYSSNKTKLVSQKVSSFFLPPPPVSDLPGKEGKRAKNTPQKNTTKITENTPLSSPPLYFLPPCNFICHMICYCNLLFHSVEQNPTHFFIHPPPSPPHPKKHTLNLFYPQSSLFHLQLVARVVVVESQIVVDGLFFQ